MGSLAGHVAVLTGGSRGIGAAAGRALAREGAHVVLAARDGAACQAVAASIRDAGGAAEGVACDVSRWSDVDDLIAGAVERHGRIDALVNNAGIIEPAASLEGSRPEAWAYNIAVNLIGAYHGARAALPHLRRARSGVIVNVSSGAADWALEGWSAYCASKAGLAMLTRSLNLEARGTGIRVYGLQPGMVDTDMQTRIRASGMGRASRLPQARLTSPEVPARAIAWLCARRPAVLVGRDLDVTFLKNPPARAAYMLMRAPGFALRTAFRGLAGIG